MIINCLLITIRADFIINQIPSLAWIGLLNWIPFFLVLLEFSNLLKKWKLRIQAAKCFLIGSFTCSFKWFYQYFLRIGMVLMKSLIN